MLWAETVRAKMKMIKSVENIMVIACRRPKDEVMSLAIGELSKVVNSPPYKGTRINFRPPRLYNRVKTLMYREWLPS